VPPFISSHSEISIFLATKITDEIREAQVHRRIKVANNPFKKERKKERMPITS
jgi:hypothetical protein